MNASFEYREREAKSFANNAAEPEENIIRALFNTIDIDQRQKIS